jgi:hypothetical protein
MSAPDSVSPIKPAANGLASPSGCALDSRKASGRKRTATYRKTEKFKSTFSKWKESGGREYQRQWMAANRATKTKTLRPLTDGYVREVLTSRSILHRSEIPTSLVAIQRDHLQLKRELNKHK